MIDSRAVVAAIVVLVAYYFVSMTFHDWSIPLFSVPIVGTLVAFKPFEFLETYGLFVGAVITLLIVWLIKRK